MYKVFTTSISGVQEESNQAMISNTPELGSIEVSSPPSPGGFNDVVPSSHTIVPQYINANAPELGSIDSSGSPSWFGPKECVNPAVAPQSMNSNTPELSGVDIAGPPSQVGLSNFVPPAHTTPPSSPTFNPLGPGIDYDYFNSLDDREFDIQIHESVVTSRIPNYRGCRIPLRTRLNITYLKEQLSHYHDPVLVELLEFGFPIEVKGQLPVRNQCKNHRGALDFPGTMDNYVDKELHYGSVMGPFKSSPFSSSVIYSPVSFVEKKDSVERRVIMDLSFLPGQSVNDHIDTSKYIGNPVRLKYPKVDDLVEIIKKKGRGCALMKRDLSRAFRQLPLDPGSYNFLGWTWRLLKYFDKALIMGMNIIPYFCHWVTDAIKFIYEQFLDVY
jgi:hypothetical protein